MSTGWMIEIGTISGYTTHADTATAWSLISHATRALQLDPEPLRYYGVDVNDPNGEPVQRALIAYLQHITINQATWRIRIVASGSGPWRAWKERVARAIMRYLLAEAHRAGFDLSISVS